MGSSQSNPAAPLPSPTPQTSSASSAVEVQEPTEHKTASKTTDRDAEATLSGFDLVNYKCRRKEKAYKKCVSKYYNELFLGGQSVDQEAACGQVFERYRRCYLRGVQKEVWGKDAPPPTKNSALARFAQEEQDIQEELRHQQSQQENTEPQSARRTSE